MKSVLVIGAGISGLTVASILKDSNFCVKVIEKSNSIGGLVKCTYVDNILFHLVGGHVFNSKNSRVSDWFWSKFNKNLEFKLSKRNAKIFMNDKYFSYPIENSISDFAPNLVESIVDELISIKNKHVKADNFYEFLLANFGKTLCDLYFFPYNKKLWNFPLSDMPLDWLNGKLPMPNLIDILVSNICKIPESKMVHSSFFYPINGGSQFIVNRLAENLDIHLNYNINNIQFLDNSVIVDDVIYDNVIYTGDIRNLSNYISNIDNDLMVLLKKTIHFPYNSTTNILCESNDELEFSWLYFPEPEFAFHRVINTGKFSTNNNPQHITSSCVVEFSGKFDYDFTLKELNKLPFNARPISSNYEEASYVIHDKNVFPIINQIKNHLTRKNFYLLGRFSEWEYYNMDKAMEAAFNLSDSLSNSN